ncbi:TfoX/Sxy family protein [Magnetospira thiophila]
MSVSADYLEHVQDLLSPLGEVTARRMFGGAGLYLDGTIFGLVADDVLYFKADDGNRPDFERAGMGPFVPFADKPFPMSYWEVPPDVMEDSEALGVWAQRAWEASRRGSKPKKK